VIATAGEKVTVTKEKEATRDWSTTPKMTVKVAERPHPDGTA
jgi:hypothetical protein